jgi:signal transduction histidine kinase
VIITFIVLLFLNIYSSGRSQELFYSSKEASMIERCSLAASEIAEIGVMNTATVTTTVEQLGYHNVTRLIVTDHNAQIIYDSTGRTNVGSYALLPEIIKALQSNNVFSWSFEDGTMVSKTATPIYSYGSLSGVVYMMENDVQQGALISSLQRNILSVTLVLEVAVIIFSVFFSSRFSHRLKRIRTSMRIIRSGDYSHKVNVGGRDELTLLGDEFNDLTDKLNASEGQQRQFVSDASHELKTPLASIKLLSDSILQNEMDMETVRYDRTILQE